MWSRFGEYVRAPFEGRRAWRFVSALCAVFFVLGVLVRYSFLQALDLRFTREVQETSNPGLDALMRAATFCGNSPTLFAVATIVAVFLWSTRRKRAGWLPLISLVGLPIDMLLKEVWRRARPDAGMVNVTVKASGTSFPSGHALGGTMLYGTLAALCFMHLPKGPGRAIATGAFVLLPILIDLSRVYLGVHWFSDVVGGTAVGLALLIPLVKWYASHAKEQS